jgi:hypothetical protein
MIERERENATVLPTSGRSTLREVLTPTVLMYAASLLLSDQYPERD